MKRVLIVGAGPAGALAAYLLAQKNYEVTLIEAKTTVSKKVCGEYLCPPGKDLLVELGLGNFIKDHFLPIEGMRIVSQRGTEVPCTFPYAHYGLALKREQLEMQLIEMATAAGAKVFFNEALEKIHYQTDWTIQTKHQMFQSDLLIGADGRKSLVCKLLNLHLETKNKRVAVHCFLNKKKNFLRMGEMHLFSDSSYAGINPIHEEHTNFSIVCDNRKIKEHKNLAELINHYINSSAILKDEFELATESTPIHSVFPVTHETKDIISQNAALIGDAAGFVDPLTGEGIYQGLLSAKILSENIEDLENYKKIKNQKTQEKKRLNIFFQWFIKKPYLCEKLAQYLLKDQMRANTFVGIIGNVVTPMAGIKSLIIK